jgi:hypothetical protein
MPSRHQAGDSGEYRNEAHKMLTTKNMRTVLALVDGIMTEERARLYLGEANRIGVHEKVHEEIVGRVRELS